MSAATLHLDLPGNASVAVSPIPATIPGETTGSASQAAFSTLLVTAQFGADEAIRQPLPSAIQIGPTASQTGISGTDSQRATVAKKALASRASQGWDKAAAAKEKPSRNDDLSIAAPPFPISALSPATQNPTVECEGTLSNVVQRTVSSSQNTFMERATVAASEAPHPNGDGTLAVPAQVSPSAIELSNNSTVVDSLPRERVQADVIASPPGDGKNLLSQVEKTTSKQQQSQFASDVAMPLPENIKESRPGDSHSKIEIPAFANSEQSANEPAPAFPANFGPPAEEKAKLLAVDYADGMAVQETEAEHVQKQVKQVQSKAPQKQSQLSDSGSDRSSTKTASDSFSVTSDKTNASTESRNGVHSEQAIAPPHSSNASAAHVPTTVSDEAAFERRTHSASSVAASAERALRGAPSEYPQIIHDAKLIQNGATTEWKVGLETQDMGRIEIRTSLHDGTTQAQISVEREDLHRVMSAHQVQLSESLARQDVNLSGISLANPNLANSSGEQAGQHERQQSQHQRNTPDRGSSTREHSANHQVGHMHALEQAGNGGLSIRA